MIVVGVRVTRISTDGCAVRVQFVVGLHSVPYLFNLNFYQLILRASNDRVLFFLCPHISAGEPCTSRGRGGGSEEAQTPALCDYTVQLRGGVAWRDCTVWSCCVAVVLLRRIVPGALSTGVIHSVENLHAFDSAEQNQGSPRMQFKGSAEKFL